MARGMVTTQVRVVKHKGRKSEPNKPNRQRRKKYRGQGRV